MINFQKVYMFSSLLFSPQEDARDFQNLLESPNIAVYTQMQTCTQHLEKVSV